MSTQRYIVLTPYKCDRGVLVKPPMSFDADADSVGALLDAEVICPASNTTAAERGAAASGGAAPAASGGSNADGREPQKEAQPAGSTAAGSDTGNGEANAGGAGRGEGTGQAAPDAGAPSRTKKAAAKKTSTKKATK